MSNRNSKDRSRHPRREALPPHFTLEARGDGVDLRFHPHLLPDPPMEYHADSSFLELVSGFPQIWFVQTAPKSNQAISALALAVGRDDLRQFADGLAGVRQQVGSRDTYTSPDPPELHGLAVDQVRKFVASIGIVVVNTSRAVIDFYSMAPLSQDRVKAAIERHRLPEVTPVVRINTPLAVFAHLIAQIDAVLEGQ